MFRAHAFQMTVWLALGIAVLSAIARGFWLYRGSLTWPTADGSITRIDIERRPDAGIGGGHYFCATFSYDFRDAKGCRVEVGIKIFQVKKTLVNLPRENCPSEKKLSSRSTRKILPSTVWNWIPGPTLATGQPTSP